MSAPPGLTIGLPVYNGEQYLAQSLDSLLGQTYGDFELIVSDNASTDATEEIGREYARRDRRVSYIRQAGNLGATPNHNLLLEMAQGELFKWASHDDLYARDLLARCVAALDERPAVILAHARQAIIDSAGRVTRIAEYPHRTDSPRPSIRFRSLLFEPCGDDFYGIVRTDVLRRVKPMGSFHHADRTYVAELSLFGPFHQVPEVLYFRRDHPGRAERANPTRRTRCANLDPRRANRVVHPTVRLLAECAWNYVDAIRRAPLSPAERRACLVALAHWSIGRTRPGAQDGGWHPVESEELTDLVARTVAGRERESA